MKNLSFCILSVFFLLALIPTLLKAETDKSNTPTSTIKSVESTDNNSEASQTTPALSSDEAVLIAENAKYEAQQIRLQEINDMDKSELTAADKKELRDEVHAIQRDQDRHDRDRDRRDNDNDHRHHGGGIYISIGGGLLIILLLILLL